MHFKVTKIEDGEETLVASTKARTIRQAMTKMFGDDWEVHNTMGYLIATKVSTGEHIGILWVIA